VWACEYCREMGLWWVVGEEDGWWSWWGNNVVDVADEHDGEGGLMEGCAP